MSSSRDTAGRLPTQLQLDGGDPQGAARHPQGRSGRSPRDLLLVLDANTGQNALAQVKAFDDAPLGRTWPRCRPKLDGSAKGGVVAAIAEACGRSLRFISVSAKGLRRSSEPFVTAARIRPVMRLVD